MTTPPQAIRSLWAKIDMEDIYAFIAADSGPDRAANALRRIDKAMSVLAEAPRLGRVRAELSGSPRSYTVKPWIILYDTLPDDRGVLILRVVDGRRDLPRL